MERGPTKPFRRGSEGMTVAKVRSSEDFLEMRLEEEFLDRRRRGFSSEGSMALEKSSNYFFFL
jgi:hypothetical protein